MFSHFTPVVLACCLAWLSPRFLVFCLNHRLFSSNRAQEPRKSTTEGQRIKGFRSKGQQVNQFNTTNNQPHTQRQEQSLRQSLKCQLDNTRYQFKSLDAYPRGDLRANRGIESQKFKRVGASLLYSVQTATNHSLSWSDLRLNVRMNLFLKQGLVSFSSQDKNWKLRQVISLGLLLFFSLLKL